jgi:hypothetical protein
MTLSSLQYAECHVSFIVILNAIMLSVVMLNVAMLSVMAQFVSDKPFQPSPYF